MTNRPARRCARMCIVPPHILHALARNGSPGAQEAARLALAAAARAAADRRALPPPARRPPRTAPATAPTKQRSIYDAHGGTALPGDLVRTEGGDVVSDAAVDEVYDGFGWTWDLYWDVFGRDSYDNGGSTLIGSVHYRDRLDNAAWDGTEMFFGDGDGENFNRFTVSVDVMGHELTHGVTASESNLVYEGQSGALNESLSDAFGSMVKQYAQEPEQTAAEADWLIGAGLFTTNVSGVALRSMKAPGTAYDDDVLGRDPQPAHMDGYVTTSSDNGGVHTNSGIPNRAFYLAAIALGGHSWDKAGRIWYATTTDPQLAADSDFTAFAAKTADHALALFSASERRAVEESWSAVGIPVPGEMGS